MKKMPKNDSYASGEYPEDFCIRVRTPFSPRDTEFSFFMSRDTGVSSYFFEECIRPILIQHFRGPHNRNKILGLT